MANLSDFLKYGFQHTKEVSETEYLFHVKNVLTNVLDGLAVFRDKIEFKLDRDSSGYLIPSDEMFEPRRIFNLRLGYDKYEYEVGNANYYNDYALVDNGLIWTPKENIYYDYNTRAAFLTYVKVPINLDDSVPDIVLKEMPYVIAYGALAKLPSTQLVANDKSWGEEFARRIQSLHVKYNGGIKNYNIGNVFRSNFDGGRKGGGGWY